MLSWTDARKIGSETTEQMIFLRRCSIINNGTNDILRWRLSSLPPDVGPKHLDSCDCDARFFLHSAAMRLMLVFLLWVLFVFRLKKKETVEDLK